MTIAQSACTWNDPISNIVRLKWTVFTSTAQRWTASQEQYVARMGMSMHLLGTSEGHYCLMGGAEISPLSLLSVLPVDPTTFIRKMALIQ